MTQCQATTQSGVQCLAHALQDSPFCFTHSPDHADERIEARKFGGAHSRRQHSRAFPSPDVTTAGGLVTFIDALIHEAWAGSLPAARLRVLATLVQTQMRSVETGDIERRLIDLDRFLKMRPENQPKERR